MNVRRIPVSLSQFGCLVLFSELRKVGKKNRGNLLNELINKVMLGDELCVGTCHCEDVVRDPFNQLFVSDSNYRSLGPFNLLFVIGALSHARL